MHSLTRILSCALVGAIISTSAITAQAQEPFITVGSPLRGDEVSIRSGPGPQYTEIAVSFGDLQLPVTGRSDFDPTRACSGIRQQDIDMYLRVQFNEIEGWVWRCHPYLTVTGDTAAVPVAAAAYPVLVADAGYPVERLEGYTRPPRSPFVGGFVTYNAALVREAPDVSSEVIGSVGSGGSVYVIGRTAHAGWVKIIIAGHTGWMASHLLHLPHGWQEIIPVS
ncbi:MAG: SH3 domain-containing protein [Anaerolineae bacterium]